MLRDRFHSPNYTHQLSHVEKRLFNFQFGSRFWIYSLLLLFSSLSFFVHWKYPNNRRVLLLLLLLKCIRQSTINPNGKRVHTYGGESVRERYDYELNIIILFVVLFVSLIYSFSFHFNSKVFKWMVRACILYVCHAMLPSVFGGVSNFQTKFTLFYSFSPFVLRPLLLPFTICVVFYVRSGDFFPIPNTHVMVSLCVFIMRWLEAIAT